MLFRFFIFAAVIAVLGLVLKAMFKNSPYITCDRCEGKGYWYGTRGKEKCDWCKGEGKLPRL